MDTLNPSGQTTADSRGVRNMMRQHPLFFYFLIAYAFSWVFLIPFVLSARGLLPESPIYTLLFAIHTFGPALAAVIMTRVTEGPPGLLRLRKSIRDGRHAWLWYLFALLVVPALVMAGVLLQPGVPASFTGFPRFLPAIYLVNFIAVFFAGGPLGEEPGWRGFALPRMQPRYGPLGGTLLLGVLWCCWHLPEFWCYTQGGGPGVPFAIVLRNFTLFLLMVLSLAILFTWVYNHTRGSLWMALLVHTSINTPQLALIPLLPAVDYTRMILGYLLGFGVPALLILVLTRGRLGYMREQEGPQPLLEPQPAH